jgi:hypothetical protein
VWVSRAQFEKALDPRPANQFVLAVVEHVYESTATIHFVTGPATRVDKFCFDQGWAAAADRRVEVRGAERSAAAAAAEGAVSDECQRLIASVMDEGLPEPDLPWRLDGFKLLAAWPDDRVGIVDGKIIADRLPDGWDIRSVEEWTAAELVDTLRGGR